MTATSQDAVIAFLASPAAFGGQRPVERIDTHFSVIAMAGDTVLKLKRAVSNDLLDYGTVDRREAACRDELALNRRTAPSLYRDVLPVTRDDNGKLALDGEGEAVDWVVVMRRFDQDGLFLHLARNGRLTDDLVDRAVDAIARFHADAAPTPDHGGHDDMAWVARGNAKAFAKLAGDPFPAHDIERLDTLTRQALGRHRALMERRRTGGLTRRCHGDLHLGNICLVDGEPTLFDAVEFNDRIACCDLLYDLAFLVMDLWRRGHRGHANRTLNRYLWRTADWDGVALLPLFLSCRAAVRAKTSAWAAAVQNDRSEAARCRDEARAYLDLALSALDRPAPDLLALGGLSGTGKTTLALTLAPQRGPVPGALVLRSDVLRKQIAGVSFERHLGRDAYTEASSIAVYDRLGELAAQALGTGLCAVADAVFLKPAERAAIEAVARQAGCDFAGLWLEAPRDTLEDRVEVRSGDASDADAAVVGMQSALDPGAVAWIRIDASGGAAEVAVRAREGLPGGS